MTLKKKPTVAELEEALNDPTNEIELLPGGEITATNARERAERRLQEELAQVRDDADEFRKNALHMKQELARVTALLNRCTGALVDAGSVPTDDIEAGIRALAAQLERERVQHAGCLTYAEGWGMETPPDREQYGWSPANQAVYDLRLKYNALEARTRGPVNGTIGDRP